MPLDLRLINPYELKLEAYEEAPLKSNEIRAHAIQSGISHGTELNLYRGTSPFHTRRFDTDLRLFVEDSRQLNYPRGLGYEWVGRVEEVGEEVTDFRVGDLVHLPFSHRESYTFAVGHQSAFGLTVALPDSLDPDQAVMLALAGVALQAVHDARIKLGDHVAIFGLGVIGLLAVQLARLNGAAWVDGIDPLSARRTLAETLGADRTIDPINSDPGYVIKTGSTQTGADVAIEVSGHYAALHQAIRSVRMAGVVVAAGYYQEGGDALRLGEEWHHNRLTMISSMGVWDCPHRDYPAWDRTRIHEAATHLLASGQLRTDGMITHRIPYSEAARAYELVDQHPEETVKVVLTY